jgi:hypothetical protein
MHLLDEQPEVGEPNPVIRCISEFTTGQISLTCVPFSFSTSIEITTHQLFIGTMENRSWATANWPAPQVIVSVSVRCFSFVLLLGLWGLLLGLWGLLLGLWGLLWGLLSGLFYLLEAACSDYSDAAILCDTTCENESKSNQTLI